MRLGSLFLEPAKSFLPDLSEFDEQNILPCPVFILRSRNFGAVYAASHRSLLDGSGVNQSLERVQGDAGLTSYR